ncbi:hypothetical protein HOY82DRAFT_639701 [Tuber indicum]|nr:hypothetical protein HOY82DRAFT_639701 [Tuber indicum]
MRSKPLSLTGRDVPSSDGRAIERSGTERDPGVDPEMIDVPGSPQPPTNQATQGNPETDTEMDTEIDSPPAQGDTEIDTEIDSPPLPRSLEPQNDRPRPAGGKRPLAASVSYRDAKRIGVEHGGPKRGTVTVPGRRWTDSDDRLTPRQVSLRRCKVNYVAAGPYHSFAITRDGSVWAWGSINMGNAGYASLSAPGRISCRVRNGVLLVWGRLDSGQLGINPAALSAADCVRDSRGNPRYLRTPHAVPGIRSSTIGCGTDHNIAVSMEGQAYSWGFSGSYQTGLGPDADDEITTPTKIENTATRGIRMTFAAAGGQFSILAGVPADPANVNGADTNDEEAVEEGGD